MSHRRTPRKPAPFGIVRLEDRVTPSAAVATAAATTAGVYALGVDAGLAGNVTVYNADGTVQFTVAPYGGDFTGGVRVAVADVTGDGISDLVTAPGAGVAGVVKVYDGATQQEVGEFAAYEAAFTGGLNVAAADLTGDGRADIVTGADQGGGPRVKVFDGSKVSGSSAPAVLSDFLAINDPNFRGGVRLTLGDISGDGVADLIVGAGFGGGPRVAGFDGAALGKGTQTPLFADFFAYEQGLRNGITVSVGDVTGDGIGDLIFGGGPGGGPRVRVADGAAVRRHGGGGSLDAIGADVANYFAGDPNSRDGVRVGVRQTATGAEVVGVDVASGVASAFDLGGRISHAVRGAAGFFASAAFDKSSYDIGRGGTPTTDAASTAVATQFVLRVERSAYVGAETRVSVVALDASNHRVRNYTGTVRLTTSDAAVTVPAAYTFTAADRGEHAFTFTPLAAGNLTVTATDATTATVAGTVVLAVTTAPVATHFAVETRREAYAGAATRVAVVALDASNRPVRDYAGTVALTSSDAAATLPAAYTFTAADRGAHVFMVTPAAAGSTTVTATDTAAAAVVGTVTLNVVAAPVATHFAVEARRDARAGSPTQFLVVALGANDRPVPTYAGTAVVTSSDAAATLPAAYTFTPADHGVHVFETTLATPGEQTLTVTDGTLTGVTTLTVRAAGTGGGGRR